MNNEEQYSPFIHKEPKITPLSSLPLRGAEYLEIATAGFASLAMTDEGSHCDGSTSPVTFTKVWDRDDNPLPSHCELHAVERSNLKKGG
jgi:hypothetical protein